MCIARHVCGPAEMKQCHPILFTVKECSLSLSLLPAGVTDAQPSEALSSEDRRTMMDQMVASFGSERKKRVHAAAKRNRIETSALEVALESAVTHATTEAEKTGGSQGG